MFEPPVHVRAMHRIRADTANLAAFFTAPAVIVHGPKSLDDLAQASANHANLLFPCACAFKHYMYPKFSERWVRSPLKATICYLYEEYFAFTTIPAFVGGSSLWRPNSACTRLIRGVVRS